MNEEETERLESQLRHRAKMALRNRMRAVRGALPAAACDSRSKKIHARLWELAELERASTVLAFATIGNEVRTRACIESAWAKGKRVGLPRVVGDELHLHRVDPGTALEGGSYSVPEPAADAPQLDPTEVDFALIPALAVDPRGYRIGYGGGYYDRLIPRLKRACTCAIAYDFQLISEVPELPFDVRVDLVVTDERVIRSG